MGAVLEKIENSCLLYTSKVSKHRERQELSSFITAYNWPNEELRQVAVAAFDLYRCV